ncbi:MAG: hypothetical protein A2161_11385 [Candidatus Schekmanbacteria bacterium RBG_13_48_7]|uniref:Uncharacterized protein n=1 Tax=Candidatus Schekmanbacteria bacterium RBG_13_48_7 TaxID=1817878 RepID=A0A1F7S8B6_9BACT|nr:MAG: hypothetical protein A2161_11385 [Candidatus Schekmanbacteria bacterium RBG_13_48_7]
MTQNNKSDEFSVEKIMKMIREERSNSHKNQQQESSTKDQTSRIAPYEETVRIKAQNFINQNWHINIHSDEAPFPTVDETDENNPNLDYLNKNYELPFLFHFESRFKVLRFILNPFKKIIRKIILSSIGELFSRQEQFNSHLVRLLNRHAVVMNHVAKIMDQVNSSISKQREVNQNLVTFCNQINFREDVLTIKCQHTDELIRELYRRMDNLYVVSNLAFILEEKVKKLQQDLEIERESMNQLISLSRNQT